MDANIIRLVRLALGIVTDRLLTLVALGMSFALVCWAMKDPDWMREAMAGFFVLFVFLPCLLKERAKRHDSTDQAPDGL